MFKIRYDKKIYFHDNNLTKLNIGCPVMSECSWLQVILTSWWVELNNGATPFSLSCFQDGNQSERFKIHLWSF